ncbi:hypothetical protein MMC07_005723 [Pseudocyphellaria aurata]|nr:hypothetical protein [Pseudocyphellaria aurata]
MSHSEEKRKMLRGDLFHAFSPALVRERRRCYVATSRFNNAGDVSRRRLVELWKDINGDSTPLPPAAADAEDDAALFEQEPWIEAPIHIDYGTNVHLGANVFINFNCTILDTCLVTIGARTVVGPNVSFFSGTHPLDPAIRNGTKGPEYGKEIHVGEDCWIGGNAIILPGISIGQGATIGAGSVVTRNVPPFHVAAGNPARVIRKIKTNLDPEQSLDPTDQDVEGAEVPMAEFVDRLKVEP